MTKALRWRVLVLQAGLVLILGFVAGFAFWAAGFTHNSVTTQLAAQNITFPAANSAEITSLPAVDAAAMRQYAGDVMTTGPQAEVWADNFIKVHLSEMPTYDAASGLARANPTSTVDAQTEATVFQGTTLRSMLLNAYGWWTVGTYALYAAIGLTIAAGVVLLTFIFELWRWRVEARGTVPATVPAPAFSPVGSVPAVGIAQMTRHDS
ncbi:MAG: hypothetical protein ABSE52_08910 [Candidatus Dormibacteria bacterium]|jgi:hypothetical protein